MKRLIKYLLVALLLASAGYVIYRYREAIRLRLAAIWDHCCCCCMREQEDFEDI